MSCEEITIAYEKAFWMAVGAGFGISAVICAGTGIVFLCGFIIGLFI